MTSRPIGCPDHGDAMRLEDRIQAASVRADDIVNIARNGCRGKRFHCFFSNTFVCRATMRFSSVCTN